MNRREFTTAAAGALLARRAEAARLEGELLYNGIRLPAAWPPRREALSDEPSVPSYLASPPAVIPIDLGRQLFVDGFLIERTTLTRSFHQAEYHPACPVLKPDRSWERGSPEGATAMAFSDGAWYDPRDRLFKLWYMGGYSASTCYAASTDGIHWQKPDLDVRPGANIVQPQPRDSVTVWLDQEEKDPKRRFKLFRSYALSDHDHWGLYVYFSPDGVHWGEPVLTTGLCGDRTTVFWNPFRKVWVYSLRGGYQGRRVRRYWEVKDVLRGPQWSAEAEPAYWVGADRLDGRREDLKTPPQLYNLDCVAYESVLLGLFTIWRGQPKERPKPNEVSVGFSRDGFQWDRTGRRALIPVSEHQGDWNWGNVQSAGGGCLVVGDKLYFYCSGRAGIPGTHKSGESTTGLAILRRDGFASMDAGAAGGELTTRPVRFSGKHCFVNADAAGGELRVELLDAMSSPIRPFTRKNCLPVRQDGTLQEVRWKGARDLSSVAGRPVRFRFHLTRGRLYAFWVSPEPSGASRGYVAGGGPGFTGPTDTVGRRVLSRDRG